MLPLCGIVATTPHSIGMWEQRSNGDPALCLVVCADGIHELLTAGPALATNLNSNRRERRGRGGGAGEPSALTTLYQYILQRF